MPSTPNLSVVICTHNRGDLLPELLRYLDAQTADMERFEVVVVGNGITDGTDELIKSLVGSKTYNLIYVDEPILGLSVARNTGIENSNADVVAFVDDDFLPDTGWADGMLNAFENVDVGIVGGRTHLKFIDCNEPPWLDRWHRRMLGENDREVDALIEGRTSDVFGNNFAFRKVLYKEVGGFKSEFGRVGAERGAGEELEFIVRGMAAGYKIYYQPAAFGWHFVTADRLTAEYLRDCAFGAEKSNILVRARSETFSPSHLQAAIREAEELGAEERKWIGSDYRKWVLSYTRRFGRLGRIHAIASLLFGGEATSDFSHASGSIKTSDELMSSLVQTARQQAKVGEANFANLVVRSSLTSQFLDCLPDELVSVVLITHNDGRFVGKSLASILTQSHTNIECLVVDNNSTDNTLSVISAFAEIDTRVKVTRLVENCGPSRARNIGIEAARGKFLCFMDGDDLMYQDSIAVRLAAAHHFAFDGIAGSYVGENNVSEFDGELPQLKPSIDPRWLEVKDFIAMEGDCPFGPRNVLVLTDIMRKLGGFNEDMSQAEDWEIWARFFRHGYSFVPTGYDGTGYRQKRGSLARHGKDSHLDNSAALFAGAFRRIKEEERVSGTPFVYEEPVWYYTRYLKFAERVLRTIGMSSIQSTEDMHEIMQVIPRHAWDVIFNRINIRDMISFGEERIRAIYGWKLDISSAFVSGELAAKAALLFEARAGLRDDYRVIELPLQDRPPLKGEVVKMRERQRAHATPSAWITHVSAADQRDVAETFVKTLGQVIGTQVGRHNTVDAHFDGNPKLPLAIDLILGHLGKHGKSKSGWTNTYPPTPAGIGPFTIFDLGSGQVQIRLRRNQKLETIFNSSFQVTAPLRITIIVDRHGKARLFVNGEKSSEAVKLDPDAFVQNSRIKLGHSFAERYWEGQILYCRILSGVGLNRSVVLDGKKMPPSIMEIFNIADTRSQPNNKSSGSPRPNNRSSGPPSPNNRSSGSPSLRSIVKAVLARIPFVRRYFRR